MLTITKFNGTYLDWNRFGGQFTEAIDKTGCDNEVFLSQRICGSQGAKKKLTGSHLPRKGTICCLDSTVALHWLRDQGEYRQFVTNHVRKIQSHPNTQWCHVPSTENPADLGSRGVSVTDVQLWWRGPEWLADLTSWPEDIVTQASQQSDAERKVQ